jgi:hypothetical protein
MKTPLEIFADELDMPVDHIREAAQAIRQERMRDRLPEKVRIIRSGNTAITPEGKIVERGMPESTPYETSERIRKP